MRNHGGNGACRPTYHFSFRGIIKALLCPTLQDPHLQTSFAVYQVPPYSFSLLSQQPFGILISNFTHLFSEMLYI